MSQSSFGVQINDASCEIQAGKGWDEEKAEAEEGKAGCSKGCGLGQFQGGRLLEKIWFVPSLMTAVKGVEGYNFTMISFLSLQ